MFTMNELAPLASVMAKNVQNDKFQYLPKRAKIKYPIVSGWSEKFSNYYWSSATEALSDWQQITDLSERLGGYARLLDENKKITNDHEASAIRDTIELFKWGGVLRGKNHNPPPIEIINNVIKSAIAYDAYTNAPMDSAWTKLAAFSTAWLEKHSDKPPHIIYDSRVSVALLERIDQAVDENAELMVLKNRLIVAGLGYVHGRGGNRELRVNRLIEKNWRNGYGKWDSQIIASKIIDALVLELNTNKKYGSMNYKSAKYEWNSRGVEMVFFMEGY
jgi:hypothetical protein